ncbi:unnamed protein product [Fraxinus pennsylvanica]|uniref:Copper amine oxidase N3-terminal domain-containing protein n=1 Tax=Fraxinus pennsylvanica TaxID=56036 RepID=A0AAD2E9A0_9LAMI|nr:unnamed protein product [Fraxinus pennsylvanica]
MLKLSFRRVVSSIGKAEESQRLIKVQCYSMKDTANFYKRPIEGLTVVVDLDTKEVLKITDNAAKVSESGLPLPPTGMAAHVVEEDVEVVEMEEKAHVVIVATLLYRFGGNATFISELLFAYLAWKHLNSTSRDCHVIETIILYMGDDKNVDIDGPDEEMVEVGIV